MKKKFIVIGSRGVQGFFSNFLHTLQYLHLAELKNKIPIVHWQGGVYDKHGGYQGVKKNVWEYYFEPVSSYSMKDIQKSDNVEKVNKYHATSLPSEPTGCWDFKTMPPSVCLNNPDLECRLFVNSIINKYVKIREYIQDEIDTYYESHMKNRHILGVHIRYCNDMRPAQGPDPLQTVISSIHNYVDRHTDSMIFLATDFKPFLKSIRKEFKDRVIYTSSTRSKDGNPVQYACKPKKKHTSGGPAIGKEVIVDCKLLSMCDCLYHGCSNVSSVALYWNPNVEHKYVLNPMER